MKAFCLSNIRFPSLSFLSLVLFFLSLLFFLEEERARREKNISLEWKQKKREWKKSVFYKKLNCTFLSLLSFISSFFCSVKKMHHLFSVTNEMDPKEKQRKKARRERHEVKREEEKNGERNKERKGIGKKTKEERKEGRKKRRKECVKVEKKKVLLIRLE